MATSGQTSLEVSRNQIIKHAARLVGALRNNESIGNDKFDQFNYALNAMVKSWQVKGMRVWTVQEAVLIPQANQSSYVLSSTGDHVTLADSLISTMTAAEAITGASSISVDSAAGIAGQYHVGILADDGTVFWTTANGDPVGNTINLASALTSDIAEDTFVYAYQTKIPRPLGIATDGVRMCNMRSQTVRPINLEARKDFRWLSNPNGAGDITQVMFDKKRTDGRLEVWQTPQAVTELIKFTFHQPIERFEAAGDNPDLPEEWILALGFNLALIVAPEYGLGERRYAMIEKQAIATLDDLIGSDREDTSLHFGMDTD